MHALSTPLLVHLQPGRVAEESRCQSRRAGLRAALPYMHVQPSTHLCVEAARVPQALLQHARCFVHCGGEGNPVDDGAQPTLLHWRVEHRPAAAAPGSRLPRDRATRATQLPLPHTWVRGVLVILPGIAHNQLHICPELRWFAVLPALSLACKTSGGWQQPACCQRLAAASEAACTTRHQAGIVPAAASSAGKLPIARKTCAQAWLPDTPPSRCSCTAAHPSSSRNPWGA